MQIMQITQMTRGLSLDIELAGGFGNLKKQETKYGVSIKC